MTDKPLNLYQRLNAIIDDLGDGIEATGSDQYKKKAISITDVEQAVRRPMTVHGVTAIWGSPRLEALAERLWAVNCLVTLVNSDSPEDRAELPWADTGGSPAAAYSFARKSFYKAIFHLTEEGDEEGQTPGRSQPAASTQRAQPKPQERQEPESPPEDVPMKEEYRPATANQISTISKLSAQLNMPFMASPDMTYFQASEKITELSKRWNERSKAGAR